MEDKPMKSVKDLLKIIKTCR